MIIMVYRLCSSVFCIGALAAFLFAACLYLHLPGEGRGLAVDQSNRVLHGLVAERDYEIEFRVHNRTERPLRVVGAPPFC